MYRVVIERKFLDGEFYGLHITHAVQVETYRKAAALVRKINSEPAGVETIDTLGNRVKDSNAALAH